MLHLVGRLSLPSDYIYCCRLFSSFFCERTHHVTSDTHVKYSRACNMLFLLLLPETNTYLCPTCSRSLPMHQRHVHVSPTKRGDDVNKHEQTKTPRIAARGSPPPPGHLFCIISTLCNTPHINHIFPVCLP